MTKFEEEFPSLIQMVALSYANQYEMKAWTENCIQKTCLDKQRVKESIYKLMPSKYSEEESPDCYVKQTLGELKDLLGLEND